MSLVRYGLRNRVVLAFLGAALVSLAAGVATGNGWFFVMARAGLICGGVASVVVAIRQTGAEQSVPGEQIDAAARQYVLRVFLFGLAGAILAASIYDHGRLWRAIF